MNDHSDDNPKIIVDTDWKAQVEAEKEELRRREQEAASATATANGKRPEASPGRDDGPMPPATFSMLVSSLATQAMIALGQIADPLENKAVIRLPHARYHIDMLGVLEEKTKGNLTQEEKAVLSRMLTDLRMAYVTVESHVKSAKKTPA